MKNLLLVFVVASFNLAFAADKMIPMDEVMKHNTPASCWIVIDNGVYDVTPMLEKHNPVLKKQCGKDASQGFKTKAGSGKTHSDKAMDLRTKFKIGELKK